MLFAATLIVFHVNDDFLTGGDAKPNVYLPLSLIREHNLSFSPAEMPFMFAWELRIQEEVRPVRVAHWGQRFGDQTAGQLRQDGRLRLQGGNYYVLESKRTDPNTGEPLYVSTFGVGAGLTALPLFAALHLAVGDLAEHPKLLWYGAKSLASVLVAGSAVFVFLTAARYTRRKYALLLALSYALGTCVWSISSQTLWQHGPSTFFLAMGTYFLTGVNVRLRNAAYCGLSLGMAVLCRPTGAVAVLAVAGYLLIVNRKALGVYLLAGLPLAVGLGLYNNCYLGSPIEFGQAARAAWIAEYKTGTDQAWQTPLWEGAAGLMISPSRGLLVYSPFLLLAFPGAWRVWRRDGYSALRPVSIAVLIMWGLSFKRFDWWGGWSFGYRLLVDTLPMVVLFLVPMLASLFKRPMAATAVGLLLAWSIMVQVLGAFAYNVSDWNARLAGFEVGMSGADRGVMVPARVAAGRLIRSGRGQWARPVHLDIDRPQHRHRLWSVSDSQILYYLTHFFEARQAKKASLRDWLADPSG
ncbi:MAG: hypothetical protein GY778_18640 [bacterium]|nr:hypothetical protein [bacterium]